MVTYDIVITNPAEKDLLEIGNYISKELLEPQSAQRVISKIADVVTTLEKIPFRHALVYDTRLNQMGIRHIIVDQYIVFYIVSEDIKTVTIIRVLYNKRDWQNLL